VKGSVAVGISGSSKKARGIRVELIGDCLVKIQRTTGSGSNKNTYHYSSYEKYVDEKKYVVGGSAGEIQIPVGHHTYSFQFQLPKKLPSSFIGSHGEISYSVKAVIDRPWRFDHKTVKFFNVVGVLDLNKDGGGWSSQSASNEKMFGSLCCVSGPLSATVQLPRSGYVPGENITLEAEADNKSSQIIEKTVMKLLQTIVYKAEGHEETIYTTIVEREKGGVYPGDSEVWKDSTMKVPALPPSELPRCTNIEIKYEIEFTCETRGFGSNLRVSVPVFIGTIPLKSSFSQFRARPSTNIAPSVPCAPTVPDKEDKPPPFSAFAAYPDLPPPTYEQARNLPSLTKDDSTEKHTQGNWNFKPSYPYYK